MDTPGFGVGLEEEEHTIDGLVNFLKEDLKYVNAFVIAFKQMDYRPTTAFKTMIKIVDGIFGEEFWDRVIIEATFWGYSEEKIEERDLTEEEWLNHTPKKTLNGTAPKSVLDNLKAVFIDSFYRSSDPHQEKKFKENTDQLLKFATEGSPFHCKDIKSVKHELRLLKEEKEKLEKEKRKVEADRAALEASCEGEKSRLMESLATANDTNRKLEEESASLKKEKTSLELNAGHGTDSLVLVSFALMIVGVLVGFMTTKIIQKRTKVESGIEEGEEVTDDSDEEVQKGIQ